MQYQIHHHGNIVVLALSGNIMGRFENQTVCEQIQSLKIEGINKLIFDLGQVTHINSTGIGTLVSSVTSMRGIGGDVRLANLSERAKRIIEIVQIGQVVDICETVDQAITSYTTEQS